MTEPELLAFLDAHEFVYQRVEHPTLFTCAESEAHRLAVSVVSTKNWNVSLP